MREYVSWKKKFLRCARAKVCGRKCYVARTDPREVRPPLPLELRTRMLCPHLLGTRLAPPTGEQRKISRLPLRVDRKYNRKNERNRLEKFHGKVKLTEQTEGRGAENIEKRELTPETSSKVVFKIERPSEIASSRQTFCMSLINKLLIGQEKQFCSQP